MGKVTIQELSRILVEKNRLSTREASEFATQMFQLILERLQQNDQVKIKGLGTFKIISVEARESVSVRTGERVVIDSHAKVSFTPDTVMKELVNRPFSQFETVVLNDGVEFADMADSDSVTDEEFGDTEDADEQEIIPTVEPAVTEEKKPLQAFEPETEPEQDPETEPVVELEPEPEPEPVVEPEPIVEHESEPEPEAESTPEAAPLIEILEPEPTPWGKWILAGFSVFLLMAVSAVGGYYYGTSTRPYKVVTDTIVRVDTVKVEQSPDTVATSQVTDGSTATQQVSTPAATQQASTPAATQQASTPSTNKNTPADPGVVTLKATSLAAPSDKGKTSSETVDRYAAKDERVRLGAYRIVGLSHEVTVLQGQTFYSICRAHLGPDMECYVEVFNNLPSNPKIKAGQVIKIPKLELKKRKR
jgi:nucleoid DNA-binding protein